VDNLFFKLFAAIALLGLVGAFGTIVWLHRMLPDDIRRKYSATVLFRCKFPLSRDWEAYLEPADVPIFRKYRRVFLMWYLIAAAIIAVELLILQKT
jgi:hypothetical protein